MLSLHSDLVADALGQALQSRRPAPGLIFHSDCGTVRRPGPPLRPVMRRDDPEHVRTGQPLPQRLERILHGHPQERAGARR